VALADMIMNPVKPHVDCLGSLLFYVIVDDALSDFVVCLNGCCRLGMPHALGPDFLQVAVH